MLGDGVRFVFEVSSRYADKRREVRLHCRDGVAVLPHGEADFIEITRHSDTGPQSSRMPISAEPPLRRQLRACLDHVRGGPPPRTSASEAARARDCTRATERTSRHRPAARRARNLKESLYATVMVPTTAGRGPLLPFSIGSILSQTVRDFELFIMGDGVDEATRRQIHDLMRRDARIRFFDYPKHERRGEPHRHAALAERTASSFVIFAIAT